MSTKPLKLYGHVQGPNPWKVAIILEELGVPYETEYMDFGDLKKEPFLSKNPNGRTPALEDPNTGVTTWEVCRKRIPMMKSTKLKNVDSLVRSSIICSMSTTNSTN